jgi:hypothetical protein
LVHHLHRQRLEGVAPNGTILWKDHDEFLAQTETKVDVEDFHETGPSRFAAYDLQVRVTGHRYYFYSEEAEDVAPPDLCCHGLLIADGSRHRSYCLLLLSHDDLDEDDLRERAAKYDLEDENNGLLRYLETHGDVDDVRLPDWDEFQELAAE